jgi:hypothetical protein
MAGNASRQATADEHHSGLSMLMGFVTFRRPNVKAAAVGHRGEGASGNGLERSANRSGSQRVGIGKISP